MHYPEPIENLIECYKKLPSVGEKSAERYALASLEMDDSIINLFSKSLTECKNKITRCKNCNNYATDDLCEICKDSGRDKTIICVVEEPKNVILFEKLNIFNGKYHVLGGLISPLDGINPENINLASLFKNIKDNSVQEIILALKPTVEGETTSLYIKKRLSDTKVKVTKIAHGIPLGADIDYVDSLTLELALENRKDITEN